MTGPWLCECAGEPTIDVMGECLRCRRLAVHRPGARLEGSCLLCALPGTEPLIVNEIPVVLCAGHFVNVRWDHAK